MLLYLFQCALLSTRQAKPGVEKVLEGDDFLVPICDSLRW